jgi:sulfite reductase (ferredoxin)
MTPPDGTATAPEKKPSAVEALKQSSRHLRGALAEELAGGGTQVSEDGYNLLKFHGSYEQYDRDTATALKQAGEEKDYSFMVRVRMPGGRLTASQYLALDDLAGTYANGSLRLTSRQGVQFHGILKHDLKASIAAINDTLLTTLAACGDVVRNVMTTPRPVRDAVHARLDADARLLSTDLLPASRAYHEIFLDEVPISAPEVEPLYGATYLPRKFKIALATPRDNSVDVLTNDLGLIAIFEGDTLIGYNVAVGGGLGMTHNRANTYPRMASLIGSVGPDELLAVTHAVIALQRDHGDRTDRKRARLKYVVQDRGLEWVRTTLATYFGKPLAAELPMPAFEVPEILGWHEQGDGRWWLGVPVPSGRIADGLRIVLREIVTRWGIDPVVTPQQDILLTGIAASDREAIETLLREHGVTLGEQLSPLARWTLACPALPTCGLALTEAERVRGPIVTQLEQALAAESLSGERISLRITGCPNGCVRSYAGDIGLVGRVPGSYAMYVGGDFVGTRLSFKLHERVPEAGIGAALQPLFRAFAADRQDGEGFGDFCHRQGEAALLALS